MSIKDTVTCDFCHMSYCNDVAGDRRKHEKYHQICSSAYSETLALYPGNTPWFRPKVENAGVYLALNELNPRLLGFSHSGISEEHWEAIQQGKSKLPIGKGSSDGHDRLGEWVAPDGTKYTFHANWRCGQVDFSDDR